MDVMQKVKWCGNIGCWLQIRQRRQGTPGHATPNAMPSGHVSVQALLSTEVSCLFQPHACLRVPCHLMTYPLPVLTQKRGREVEGMPPEQSRRFSLSGLIRRPW